MLHLSSERLASLADERPTAAEAIHLAGCTICAEARRRHQELLESARLIQLHEGTPLTEWQSLSTRLAAEGLVRPPQVRRPWRPIVRTAAAVAAALLLMATGAAFGRFSAGVEPVPGVALVNRTGAEPAAAEQLTFASTAEALDVLLRSERQHQSAAAYLAANDPTAAPSTSAERILARLDAIDKASDVFVAALRDAPTDPVLNGYYLSALGAREASVRQLNQIVPVGYKVSGY